MNKYRGERTIEIEGTKYCARPTHEAMARIEATLNRGIMEVSRRCVTGTQTAAIIAAVIYHCLEEGLKEGEKLPWPLEAFSPVAFEMGYVFLANDSKQLSLAMMGGNAFEPEETEKTTPEGDAAKKE